MRAPIMLGILFIAVIVVPPIAAGNEMPIQSIPGSDTDFVTLTAPETPGDTAGSLTTVFAANGAGAGNMFDITPLTDITEITGLDLNMSSAGHTVSIEVYYKLGTCVGFETDPGPWTLFATGTGLSAGWDNPMFVDISGNGISFSAGQVYGIYVHQANYPDVTSHIARTNGGPNTYANADLSLTTNCSLLYPAFGSAFFYRVWNGTLYYTYDAGEPLTVDPASLGVWTGGTANFALDGGPATANKKYILLGSITGTEPGTPLPGGAILPLNWDVVTDILFLLTLNGHPITLNFRGTLDANGRAEASLNLPGGFTMASNVTSYYAWCTYHPFEFVSNPVELLLTND